MNHYLGNGCSEYNFWNGILADQGESAWGWKQNALIRVDSHARTFTYTPEYYAVKHYSQAMAPGCHVLAYVPERKETRMPVLVVRTTQGKLAVMAGNFGDAAQTLTLKLKGRYLSVSLAAHSMNTFLMQ